MVLILLVESRVVNTNSKSVSDPELGKTKSTAPLSENKFEEWPLFEPFSKLKTKSSINLKIDVFPFLEYCAADGLDLEKSFFL